MITVRSAATFAAFTVFAGSLLAGCGEQQPAAPQEEDTSAATSTAADSTRQDACPNRSDTGMPLFGDLHVHTSFSFDAAANTTGATPGDAQRYARGEPIPFWPLDEQGRPVGSTQIDRPLDFLAVTDHGEFLGERAICRTPDSPRYDTEFCTNYRANERQGMSMLGTVITTETPSRIEAVCGDNGALCREYAKTPWQAIQEYANEANTPCEFTSFIAYEYTGTPGGSNYHRNVIFRGDVVPELPVSYVDAPIDSKLWAGLDADCDSDAGCEYLTIPHNTNLANGRMAPYRKLQPTPENKRAYAQTRQRREPIMEIFQHKGNSECVNGLSSVLGAPDELCDIEAVRHMGAEETVRPRRLEGSELTYGDPVTSTVTECAPGEEGDWGMVGAGCIDPTDFQRSALLIGLREADAVGVNPVKLGVIAATDTHTATPGGVSEENWGGAVTGEATPRERLEPGVLTSGIDGNPGGLAGVWAQENTREAVFDAMLRREVFGTSGPRIVPRLFVGWELPADACDDPARTSLGYDRGVPMGGELTGGGADAKPELLVYAAKDPVGEDLTALHIVKGTVDAEGNMRADVIPVAGNDTGAASLCAVYSDQDFDPETSTYYYLRVVSAERPRWHTYDCARLAEGERPEVCTNGAYPDTVHEMAWTSPVWYHKP